MTPYFLHNGEKKRLEGKYQLGCLWKEELTIFYISLNFLVFSICYTVNINCGGNEKNEKWYYYF